MTVLDSVTNGLGEASGGKKIAGEWTPINGIGNGEPTNIAHVYPFNAINRVVKDALNKWPDPSKTPTAANFDHDAPARLLAFFDWLFLIDPDAVVNKDFHIAAAYAGRPIPHLGKVPVCQAFSYLDDNFELLCLYQIGSVFN